MMGLLFNVSFKRSSYTQPLEFKTTDMKSAHIHGSIVDIYIHLLKTETEAYEMHRYLVLLCGSDTWT